MARSRQQGCLHESGSRLRAVQGGCAAHETLSLVGTPPAIEIRMKNDGDQAAGVDVANRLWQDAADMAAKAHAGQRSPGTRTPYFAHVARVAMLVAVDFGCDDPEILASAYLHDVIEKTTLTRARIAAAMGETVADWVEWLSKNAKGPREEYWKRLAQAPWQVRLVKIADALDHLNGPKLYEADRLKTARKALRLASSPEALLQRAAAILEREVARLESG